MSTSASTALLAAQQLTALRTGFEQLATQACSAADIGQRARDSQALLAALPPRYADVLLNLLDRLESSALFQEESCSFSQQDLLENLQQWGDKAQAQLEANA